METTPNNEVSERYRKYLIQIQVKETFYYLVWGTDMTDPEQQDKLLLDQENQILVFPRIDQLADFITKQSVSLYDEANFLPWAAELTGTDANALYDLDYLHAILTSELKQEQILQNPNLTKELIDFFNLVGDYAYQTEDDSIFKPYRKPQLQLFFDYCYDTYFWTIPKEELQQRQSEVLSKFRFNRFRADMDRLLKVFLSHCRLVADGNGKLAMPRRIRSHAALLKNPL